MIVKSTGEKTAMNGCLWSRRALLASGPALMLAGPLFPASARSAGSEGRARQIALEHSLQRLRSTLTVMMIGAHPDDERSGLIAALRFGLGARPVIALATRGEGGQNAIGPEAGVALAALRTREMEEAARILDASVEWLGDGPHDDFADFGYSRSREDTLDRWGEPLLAARLARAIRRHKPDILVAAFADAEGTHAHHRAVTYAAAEALRLAAAPGALADSSAQPWGVPAYFVPARSSTETDVVIHADLVDRATGMSFARLAEESRIRHRSQTRGIVNPAPPAKWPLRRLTPAPARGAGDIRAGLPARIGDLASLPGMSAAGARALRRAQAVVDGMDAAAPPKGLIAAGIELGRALAAAEAGCPRSLAGAVAHRLARKRRELDALLFTAAGLTPSLTVSSDRVAPGGAVEMPLEGRLASAVLMTGAGLVAQPQPHAGFHLVAAPDAPVADAFPRRFDPLGGNGVAWVRTTARIEGYDAVLYVDPVQPTHVVPALAVRFEPEVLLFNLALTPRPQRFHVRLDGAGAAEPKLEAPAGLTLAPGEHPLSFTAQARGASIIAGAITARLGEEPAATVTRIAYPHIGAGYLVEPARLPICAVHAALPDTSRVGCLGSDSRLPLWLERLGMPTERFEASARLARFGAIVATSDAYNGRPESVPDEAALHGWLRAGGHLIVLAQRRSPDGAIGVPLPYPVEVGKPRNAFRVTQPEAEVTPLAPDHPLLAWPNRLGPEDWQGWVQERAVGLADSWAAAYQPLIETADRGQAPSRGALLSARIGDGRVTYVALSLERQLDGLVPGAFRLLANLVQTGQAAGAPG